MTDVILRSTLSKKQKEELDIISGLLNSDSPYRLLEECEQGTVHKKTVDEVAKVDEAIFKLKIRILPLSEEEKEGLTFASNAYESLVVFCFCNVLRKEGRLIEE